MLDESCPGRNYFMHCVSLWVSKLCPPLQVIENWGVARPGFGALAMDADEDGAGAAGDGLQEAEGGSS